MHVEGQTSPHFDNHGHVTGTDSSNSLIHELTEYLQYARNHQVFIFLCLWNGAERGSTNWRLEGLIKDTGKLHTYINHALIPMVKALKDQPALAGWDRISSMKWKESSTQICTTVSPALTPRSWLLLELDGKVTYTRFRIF